MTTICSQCANLHSDAKRDRWWHWLCTAYPIDPELNYVTGENREPYALCKNINRTGDCSDFIAGPNILNPRDANGSEQA